MQPSPYVTFQHHTLGLTQTERRRSCTMECSESLETLAARRLLDWPSVPLHWQRSAATLTHPSLPTIRPRSWKSVPSIFWKQSPTWKSPLTCPRTFPPRATSRDRRTASRWRLRTTRKAIYRCGSKWIVLTLQPICPASTHKKSRTAPTVGTPRVPKARIARLLACFVFRKANMSSAAQRRGWGACLALTTQPRWLR